MRFERQRDEFHLYADDISAAPHTRLDMHEGGCFMRMLLRSVDKLSRLSPAELEDVKTPGITLGTDDQFKGRIVLRPNGKIQLFWSGFRDEFYPDALKEQTAEFTKLYKARSVVDRSFTRPPSLKERLQKLYFLSGILSFFVAVFSIIIGFSIVAFAANGLLYCVQAFVASFSYFLIFAHKHRKHRKQIVKAVHTELPEIFSPIIELISHTDRKIIEFFLILFMVFFLMGVTFSKAIPEIMKFWKSHYDIELPKE